VTDVNNAGTGREALLTNNTSNANIGGLAREVLLATPTAVTVTALVREVLLITPTALKATGAMREALLGTMSVPSPPPGVKGQMAVSINVG
jgi:hypothetical protein